MKKQWKITINGKKHELEYKAELEGRRFLVDGQPYKVRSRNVFMTLIDCPVQVDGTEVRLVAVENKVDLVVNGICQSDNSPYVPVPQVSSWMNVLMGISCIGGWLLCNLLGVALGLVFGYGYIRANMKGNNKLVACLFILCSALQIAIRYLNIF